MAENKIEFLVDGKANFKPIYDELGRLKSQIQAVSKTSEGIGRVRLDTKQLQAYERQFADTAATIRGVQVQMVGLSDSADHLTKRLLTNNRSFAQMMTTWRSGAKSLTDDMKSIGEYQAKLRESMVIPSATGAGQAMVITNLGKMADQTLSAQMAMRAYNTEMLNLGNKMVNFGKNTQWAGRQLMVGLTLPMLAAGGAVSAMFLKVDEAMRKLMMVYGVGGQSGQKFSNIVPTPEELERVRSGVSNLAKEMANLYGQSADMTTMVAADLAAAGYTQQQLLDLTKVATTAMQLGQTDQDSAIKATIALQNAYKLSTTQTAEALQFFSAAQAATSTNMRDLIDAIPRVGPIIQNLGGTYKDTVAMIVAMKEGGVAAGEGANALKNSMQRIVAPTKAAKETMAGFGIQLDEIAKSGSPVIMIEKLQVGLQKLDAVSRQQAITELFGKYQAARMTALLDNFNRSGTQSAKVMEMMALSAQDLANIQNRQIETLQQSPSMRFQAAIEGLKAQLIPIGEKLIELVTPLINGITWVVKALDKIGPIKYLLAGGLGFTAIVGPLIMFGGLVSNLVGQMFKISQQLRMFKEGFLGAGGMTAPFTALKEGLKATQNYLEEFDAAEHASREAADALTMSAYEQAESFRELTSAMAQYRQELARLAAGGGPQLPGPGGMGGAGGTYPQVPPRGPMSPMGIVGEATRPVEVQAIDVKLSNQRGKLEIDGGGALEFAHMRPMKQTMQGSNVLNIPGYDKGLNAQGAFGVVPGYMTPVTGVGKAVNQAMGDRLGIPIVPTGMNSQDVVRQILTDLGIQNISDAVVQQAMQELSLENIGGAEAGKLAQMRGLSMIQSNPAAMSEFRALAAAPGATAESVETFFAQQLGSSWDEIKQQAAQEILSLYEIAQQETAAAIQEGRVTPTSITEELGMIGSRLSELISEQYNQIVSTFEQSFVEQMTINSQDLANITEQMKRKTGVRLVNAGSTAASMMGTLTNAIESLIQQVRGVVTQLSSEARSATAQIAAMSSRGAMEGIRTVGRARTVPLPAIPIEPTPLATGGKINGPGGPKDDVIPALLSDGEYVVKADAVGHYGTHFLDSLNAKKLANGGIARFDRGTVGGTGDSAPRIITYDIDNTLADTMDPSMIEELATRKKAGEKISKWDLMTGAGIIGSELARLMKFKAAGFKVVLVTARPENQRANTEEWLARAGIPYDELRMLHEGLRSAQSKPLHMAELQQQGNLFGLVDDDAATLEAVLSAGVRAIPAYSTKKSRDKLGITPLSMFGGGIARFNGEQGSGFATQYIGKDTIPRALSTGPGGERHIRNVAFSNLYPGDAYADPIDSVVSWYKQTEFQRGHVVTTKRDKEGEAVFVPGQSALVLKEVNQIHPLVKTMIGKKDPAVIGINNLNQIDKIVQRSGQFGNYNEATQSFDFFKNFETAIPNIGKGWNKNLAFPSENPYNNTNIESSGVTENSLRQNNQTVLNVLQRMVGGGPEAFKELQDSARIMSDWSTWSPTGPKLAGTRSGVEKQFSGGLMSRFANGGLAGFVGGYSAKALADLYSAVGRETSTSSMAMTEEELAAFLKSPSSPFYGMDVDAFFASRRAGEEGMISGPTSGWSSREFSAVDLADKTTGITSPVASEAEIALANAAYMHAHKQDTWGNLTEEQIAAGAAPMREHLAQLGKTMRLYRAVKGPGTGDTVSGKDAGMLGHFGLTDMIPEMLEGQRFVSFSTTTRIPKAYSSDSRLGVTPRIVEADIPIEAIVGIDKMNYDAVDFNEDEVIVDLSKLAGTSFRYVTPFGMAALGDISREEETMGQRGTAYPSIPVVANSGNPEEGDFLSLISPRLPSDEIGLAMIQDIRTRINRSVDAVNAYRSNFVSGYDEATAANATPEDVGRVYGVTREELEFADQWMKQNLTRKDRQGKKGQPWLRFSAAVRTLLGKGIGERDIISGGVLTEMPGSISQLWSPERVIGRADGGIAKFSGKEGKTGFVGGYSALALKAMLNRPATPQGKSITPEEVEAFTRSPESPFYGEDLDEFWETRRAGEEGRVTADYHEGWPIEWGPIPDVAGFAPQIGGPPLSWQEEQLALQLRMHARGEKTGWKAYGWENDDEKVDAGAARLREHLAQFGSTVRLWRSVVRSEKLADVAPGTFGMFDAFLSDTEEGQRFISFSNSLRVPSKFTKIPDPLGRTARIVEMDVPIDAIVGTDKLNYESGFGEQEFIVDAMKLAGLPIRYVNPTGLPEATVGDTRSAPIVRREGALPGEPGDEFLRFIAPRSMFSEEDMQWMRPGKKPTINPITSAGQALLHDILGRARRTLNPTTTMAESFMSVFGELPYGEERDAEVYGITDDELAVAKELLERKYGMPIEKIGTVKMPDNIQFPYEHILAQIIKRRQSGKKEPGHPLYVTDEPGDFSGLWSQELLAGRPTPDKITPRIPYVNPLFPNHKPGEEPGGMFNGGLAAFKLGGLLKLSEGGGKSGFTSGFTSGVTGGYSAAAIAALMSARARAEGVQQQWTMEEVEQLLTSPDSPLMGQAASMFFESRRAGEATRMPVHGPGGVAEMMRSAVEHVESTRSDSNHRGETLIPMSETEGSPEQVLANALYDHAYGYKGNWEGGISLGTVNAGAASLREYLAQLPGETIRLYRSITLDNENAMLAPGNFGVAPYEILDEKGQNIISFSTGMRVPADFARIDSEGRTPRIIEVDVPKSAIVGIDKINYNTSPKEKSNELSDIFGVSKEGFQEQEVIVDKRQLVNSIIRYINPVGLATPATKPASNVNEAGPPKMDMTGKIIQPENVDEFIQMLIPSRSGSDRMLEDIVFRGERKTETIASTALSFLKGWREDDQAGLYGITQTEIDYAKQYLESRYGASLAELNNDKTMLDKKIVEETIEMLRAQGNSEEWIDSLHDNSLRNMGTGYKDLDRDTRLLNIVARALGLSASSETPVEITDEPGRASLVWGRERIAGRTKDVTNEEIYDPTIAAMYKTAGSSAMPSTATPLPAPFTESLAANGGLMKLAAGGKAFGPGGPKDDLIPAMISNGEYVVNADAVGHYGVSFLDAVNSKKLADGGIAKLAGGSGGMDSFDRFDMMMGRSGYSLMSVIQTIAGGGGDFKSIFAVLLDQAQYLGDGFRLLGERAEPMADRMRDFSDRQIVRTGIVMDEIRGAGKKVTGAMTGVAENIRKRYSNGKLIEDEGSAAGKPTDMASAFDMMEKQRKEQGVDYGKDIAEQMSASMADSVADGVEQGVEKPSTKEKIRGGLQKVKGLMSGQTGLMLGSAVTMIGNLASAKMTENAGGPTAGSEALSYGSNAYAALSVFGPQFALPAAAAAAALGAALGLAAEKERELQKEIDDSNKKSAEYVSRFKISNAVMQQFGITIGKFSDIRFGRSAAETDAFTSAVNQLTAAIKESNDPATLGLIGRLSKESKKAQEQTLLDQGRLVLANGKTLKEAQQAIIATGNAAGTSIFTINNALARLKAESAATGDNLVAYFKRMYIDVAKLPSMITIPELPPIRVLPTAAEVYEAATTTGQLKDGTVVSPSNPSGSNPVQFGEGSIQSQEGDLRKDLEAQGMSTGNIPAGQMSPEQYNAAVQRRKEQMKLLDQVGPRLYGAPEGFRLESVKDFDMGKLNEAKSVTDLLGNQDVTIAGLAKISGVTEQDSLKDALDKMKDYRNAINEVTEAGENGRTTLNNWQNGIDEFNAKTVSIIENAMTALSPQEFEEFARSVPMLKGAMKDLNAEGQHVVRTIAESISPEMADLAERMMSTGASAGSLLGALSLVSKGFNLTEAQVREIGEDPSGKLLQAAQDQFNYQQRKEAFTQRAVEATGPLARKEGEIKALQESEKKAAEDYADAQRRAQDQFKAEQEAFQNAQKARQDQIKGIQKEMDARQKLYDAKQKEIQQDQTLFNMENKLAAARNSGDLLALAAAQNEYNNEVNRQNELAAKEKADEADRSKIEKIQEESDAAQKVMEERQKQFDKKMQDMQDAYDRDRKVAEEKLKTLQDELKEIQADPEAYKNKDSQEVIKNINAVTDAIESNKEILNDPKYKGMSLEELVYGKGGDPIKIKDNLEKIKELTGTEFENVAKSMQKTFEAAVEYVNNDIKFDVSGTGEISSISVPGVQFSIDQNGNLVATGTGASLVVTAAGMKTTANTAVAYGSNSGMGNQVPVQYRSTGGFIEGPGTDVSDSIPARLSDGEYVVRARSVRKYGKGFLDAINSGQFGDEEMPRFAGGGPVSINGWEWGNNIPRATGNIPGTNKSLTMRAGVLPLFLSLAADYNRSIREITGDTYGFDARETEFGAKSDHGSGTAIDINSSDEGKRAIWAGPQGSMEERNLWNWWTAGAKSGGASWPHRGANPAAMARAIKSKYQIVIWGGPTGMGGDYSNFKYWDYMHWALRPGTDQSSVDRVLRSLSIDTPLTGIESASTSAPALGMQNLSDEARRILLSTMGIIGPAINKATTLNLGMPMGMPTAPTGSTGASTGTGHSDSNAPPIVNQGGWAAPVSTRVNTNGLWYNRGGAHAEGWWGQPMSGVNDISVPSGTEWSNRDKGPYGTPFKALTSGVVEQVSGLAYDGSKYYVPGMAVVNHNGWRARYAHMMPIIVNAGDTVQGGQTLGYAGKYSDYDPPIYDNNGNRKTNNDPHLHFAWLGTNSLKQRGGGGYAPWFKDDGSPIWMASGGKVFGEGGPQDDKIPAMLSNGEYVVRANSVKHYGVGFMDSINAGRYKSGGFITGGSSNDDEEGRRRISRGFSRRPLEINPDSIGFRGAAFGAPTRGGGIPAAPAYTNVPQSSQLSPGSTAIELRKQAGVASALGLDAARDTLKGILQNKAIEFGENILEPFVDPIIGAIINSTKDLLLRAYTGPLYDVAKGTTLSRFASGGLVSGPGSRTSDSISARLSNGEFVMSAAAVGKYGIDMMNMINSGKFNPKFSSPAPRAGSINSSMVDNSPSSSIHNVEYNVNVSVEGSNASPDDIARVVIKTLKQKEKANMTHRRIG